VKKSQGKSVLSVSFFNASKKPFKTRKFYKKALTRRIVSGIILLR